MQSSCVEAVNSAPKRDVLGATCAIETRPVFFSHRLMNGSRSHERIVCISIISQDFDSISLMESCKTSTDQNQANIVKSVPSLIISARPNVNSL